MILTGDAIYKRLGNSIIIDPFDFNKLNPNSYNLTLNNKLLVYNKQKLDMKINNDYHIVEIPEEGLLLEPSSGISTIMIIILLKFLKKVCC